MDGTMKSTLSEMHEGEEYNSLSRIIILIPDLALLLLLLLPIIVIIILIIYNYTHDNKNLSDSDSLEYPTLISLNM